MSLEEWAVCLLKPDLPKKLQEAIHSDDNLKSDGTDINNEHKKIQH
jgi:hypothetical protein